MSDKQFYHSDKYYDSYEYKHVKLTQGITKLFPLMCEAECRAISCHQSEGCIYYLMQASELHMMLFCEPTTDNKAQGLGQPQAACM